ncbi:MAG: hypothetical protein U0401_02850 [Anaerolineae bacterium]
MVELGVTGYASNSDCRSATINDGTACDRRGAARRVIILMTDGAPNTAVICSSGRQHCPGFLLGRFGGTDDGYL